MRRNSGPLEKKGFFTKRRKNTEAFSAAHNFELPGSLPSDVHRMLALNGASVAAQNTIALSGTLCLSRTLSVSRSLSIVFVFFFASGSVSACFLAGGFLFLFFRETKSARNGSHRCWWQDSWRNAVLFELRWQAYGFPCIRVLEGEEGGSRCCSRCLHSDLQVRSTAFALLCSTLFTPQLLYMFYLVCLWIFFFFCLWDDHCRVTSVSLTSWDCCWKIFVVCCLWSSRDVDTLFLIKRSTLLCPCSFP